MSIEVQKGSAMEVYLNKSQCTLLSTLLQHPTISHLLVHPRIDISRNTSLEGSSTDVDLTWDLYDLYQLPSAVANNITNLPLVVGAVRNTQGVDNVTELLLGVCNPPINGLDVEEAWLELQVLADIIPGHAPVNVHSSMLYVLKSNEEKSVSNPTEHTNTESEENTYVNCCTCTEAPTPAANTGTTKWSVPTVTVLVIIIVCIVLVTVGLVLWLHMRGRCSGKRGETPRETHTPPPPSQSAVHCQYQMNENKPTSPGSNSNKKLLDTPQRQCSAGL